MRAICPAHLILFDLVRNWASSFTCQTVMNVFHY
jgi:hypothetical protein